MDNKHTINEQQVFVTLEPLETFSIQPFILKVVPITVPTILFVSNSTNISNVLLGIYVRNDFVPNLKILFSYILTSGLNFS